MSKLVLIDGHAILHRAYHALPPLTNKEGVQTNAVYGFATMLLKVLHDLKPDYLAVAFDLPEPTFRQQVYTQYQGKRPEMESNLSDQIPLLHGMLETLKIQHFEMGGFEADDVIGSLAKQASEITKIQDTRNKEISNFKFQISNLETVIVTGDRDMLQLVNGHTAVMVPIKGLSETKTYDQETVKEEFGVLPSQWVDVKALKGDASDNYPGVRGIGPKTAQDLIARYGTLESLYKNLPELDPKLRLKLAEGVENAGMSQKLATIVTDVPVDLEPGKMKVAGIDWQAGVEYMRNKLGFKTIVERVEKEYLNGDKSGETEKQTTRRKKAKSEQMKLV